MSMQVRSDAAQAGRTGYFGEMFLTQHGQAEEFIGFIRGWYMDRRRPPDGEHSWEEIYLDDHGDQFTNWRDLRNDFPSHRDFFLRLFGDFLGVLGNADRDENGNLLPDYQYRNHHAAAWARANEDTDIVYIPFIWIDQQVRATLVIHTTYLPLLPHCPHQGYVLESPVSPGYINTVFSHYAGSSSKGSA